MLTNFILGNLIKDLLNILSTAIVLLLFLVIITFLVCSAVVIIKCIIMALVQTFKPKDDLAPDIDMEKVTKDWNDFIATEMDKDDEE